MEGLIKKVIAYSIHGFGMVKLEWDAKEQKFNSYFDVLKKQYSPDASDLKYISSLLETDVLSTANNSAIQYFFQALHSVRPFRLQNDISLFCFLPYQ